MYQSWFEYKLSRPYPFKWFTWVVVVGGVVLTVLFSIINLSADGYYLQTIYTTDPNGTASQPLPWFLQRPFNWGGSFHPTCESQLLSVGQQFFTSNHGFYYTITAVSQYDAVNDQTNYLPSVSYLNSTLTDCDVDSIVFNLLRTDTSQPAPGWWSWGASNSVGSARCTVPSSSGPMNVTFNVNYHPGAAEDFSYVIQDNFTTHAPVWWGTRLMNAYFWGTIVMMAVTEPYKTGTIWSRGSMTFVTNSSRPIGKIQDLDFFNMSYYFLQSDAVLYGGQPDPFYQIYNNASNYLQSPALTEGLLFAKIFYSLIRVDLGNSNLPNILLDEDSLRYALTPNNDDNRIGGQSLNDTSGNFCQYWRDYAAISPLKQNYQVNEKTVINETYNDIRNQTGPLTTKPAMIYSQYACSVPQRKATGTLILAVLLADLVFLSTAWRLFGTMSEILVKRKDPDAMFCAGCVRQQYQAVSPERFKQERSQFVDSNSTLQLIRNGSERSLLRPTGNLSRSTSETLIPQANDS